MPVFGQERASIELDASTVSISGTKPPSSPALRANAIEQIMLEKGILLPGAVDEIVEIFEHKLGPKNGAKVIARAWVDPDYKARLLANGTEAIRELGFGGVQGEFMVVVENTPSVHNVTVCTLCSCYPWPVLGLPPAWYKSAAYRSRIVIEPRSVLQEFGLTIPDNKEVRVWDSNSEVRYLVLPERPSGTETWSEDQLAAIVTRDAMIGTSLCRAG